MPKHSVRNCNNIDLRLVPFLPHLVHTIAMVLQMQTMQMIAKNAPGKHIIVIT